MRSPACLWSAPVVAALLLASTVDAQSIRYVNAAAPPGGDGLNWSTSYSDLQDALAEAAAAGGSIQEIWVAAGTYRPDRGTGDRTESFPLINGVGVYGGFAGGETARDERDPGLHVTILSGEIGTAAFEDNSSTIVAGRDTDATAVLDGFTIESAHTTDGWGALNAYRGSPTISHCVFQNNHGDAGSPVNVYYGAGSFADCTFRNNSGRAGAVHAYESRASFERCTFHSNSGKQAGAIEGYSGACRLFNCRFLANSSVSFSGGLDLGSAHWLVFNCVFSGNRGSSGGALSATHGATRVVNCTFTGNLASNSGAAMHLNGGSVVNSIIWRNQGRDRRDPQIEGDWFPGVRVSHSCIQYGWTGETDGGNIVSDPLLADADGPDNVAGTLDDQLWLKPGSPCIDVGDNRPLPPEVTTDLAGNPRLVNDPASPDLGLPAGAAALVDMGAYEATPSAVDIVASADAVGVPEGGSADLAVKLSADPGQAVTVSVTRTSGDTDLSIASGASLSFDSANWDTPQTVTLSAAPDADAIDGQAAFRLQATGLTNRAIVAREIEDDLAPPPPATIFYVDNDAAAGGDGLAWASAFNDLQPALAAAAAAAKPVEIRVAAGVYRPAGYGGSRSASFQLLSHVRVLGGYVGLSAPDAAREPYVNLSVLSGDVSADDTPDGKNIADNSYHVVTATTADRTALLDGFTITAGRADGNSYDTRYGSALYIPAGAPVLQRCLIVRNHGPWEGCVYTKGNPLLIACTIGWNTDSAVYNDQGAITMVDCLITGNRAGYEGSSGEATILNCTIANNGNPVLRDSYGLVRVVNSILWGSSASTLEQTLFQASSGLFIDYSCVQNWSGLVGGIGNTGGEEPFVDWLGFDGRAGTEDDNLGLRPGSPCADSGHNGLLPPDLTDLDGDGDYRESIPLDVAGRARRADDPLAADTGVSVAGEPIVDRGAYEGTTQHVLLSPPAVSIAEGGTADVAVSLALDPRGAVSVSFVFETGDADLSIESGQTLSFDSTNYNTPQVVTLRAAPDADFRNDQTTFEVSATGLLKGRLVAVEVDDEPVPPVLYVNHDATGANLGTSWADAFTSLNAALSAAGNRPGVQEIWVARGTYFGGGTLPSGVGLYGGFGGTETNREQRDPQLHITVIDGLNKAAAVCEMGRDSRIDGFTITRGYAFYGGGVGAYADNITIANCRFEANRARWAGGGVNAFGRGIIVRDCVFLNNSAGNNDDYGDQSSSSGGAMVMGGEVLVINCRFVGNLARTSDAPARGTTDAYGGAINALGGTIVNCEFSGNRAIRGQGRFTSAEGGAISVFTYSGGSFHVINSTFSENTAETAGGGILIEQYSTTELPVSIRSCIFWHNRDATGSGESAQITLEDVTGGFSVGHSCIEGLTGSLGGAGNIGTDPRFLDADGADDLLGTADDDLRLLPGSPCIDAGENAGVPAGVTTDLDGRPRLLDDPFTPDTGVGSPPIVDMGAYEFAPADAADFNRDGRVDGADLERFFACLTGPALGPPGPGCELADIDRDLDIDQADFGVLQGCFSGAGVLANPACGRP